MRGLKLPVGHEWFVEPVDPVIAAAHEAEGGQRVADREYGAMGRGLIRRQVCPQRLVLPRSQVSISVRA